MTATVRTILLVLSLACSEAASAQIPDGTAEALAFLESLQGRWSFELFPVGASRPTLTGTRTFERPVREHPMLTWTETFDGRETIVTGVLGYDESRSEFYEVGAPSGGPVDYWIGRLDTSGRSVHWRDGRDEAALAMGELAVVSPDRIEFRGASFHAVFTRAEPRHFER